MRFRALSTLISTTNSYSALRWPLFIFSILITVIVFLLFLSFQSPAWFTYESFETHGNTTKDMFEYGSFGLWEFCMSRGNTQLLRCQTWTRRSRHGEFNVILVLSSCALFLANLSFFPSWAATILLFYNISNLYIRYIVVLLWILLCLTLILTCLLIGVLILVGLTKYYSPGLYVLEGVYLFFHTGSGIGCTLAATLLAIVDLILILSALIGYKALQLRLHEEEQELYRQLTDDNSNVNWNRAVRIPRDVSILDEDFSQDPPPYNHHQYKDST